jgi:acetyl-CoA synthetase
VHCLKRTVYGRPVDDVINVSGHRLGTAEVESALVAHPAVSEAAVVGYPHDLKGQGIYCYVAHWIRSGVAVAPISLRTCWTSSFRSPSLGSMPALRVGPPGLPKTRSGKIMRRILRKIAANEYDQLGDISTLAEPAVVDDLVDNRMNR